MLVTCHVPRAALWFHRVVLRFDICTMILFLFLFGLFFFCFAFSALSAALAALVSSLSGGFQLLT